MVTALYLRKLCTVYKSTCIRTRSRGHPRHVHTVLHIAMRVYSALQLHRLDHWVRANATGPRRATRVDGRAR